MTELFSWLPPQASTFAPQHDALFWFLCGVSLLFGGLVCLLIIIFAIKYRRKEGKHGEVVEANMALELTWSIIPLFFLMIMFVWGAKLYIEVSHPPKDAMEIAVVGKQWMWKVEHTDGRREINQLHVPIGKAVRLTMISQDVIHSFGIPAFRVKQDVLPGHYTTLWFEATQAGTYHLFCNQYCGTNHSDMVGSVIAMEPMEFAKWMSGTSGNVTPVAAGRNLFDKFGCVACHQAGSSQQGPHLEGVFGHTVQFADGSSRVANEDYVRESILDPQARLVKGFGPIMPSFRGRVSEEEMMQLIAYIKSLGNEK